MKIAFRQEPPVSLSEFAHYVLKQIAYQEWVLERILQNADDLCQTGMLIDPMLTSKQAQRLLHMICFPEKEAAELNAIDQNTAIQRFFQVHFLVLNTRAHGINTLILAFIEINADVGQMEYAHCLHELAINAQTIEQHSIGDKQMVRRSCTSCN